LAWLQVDRALVVFVASLYRIERLGCGARGL
jgi:hypothetical protein